jgi:hypothetical protein
MTVYDPIQNRWQTGGGCIMSDLVIYRFQPDAMDENVLRTLLVGRDTLLQEMRREIEKAVNNRTPRYYLIVGPRGIGKSHFITLLYHDLKKIEGAIPVKLAEEEFSVYRVSDLFSRIFEEIEKKKFESQFKMDSSELTDAILENLKGRNKMVILFAENLNQILEDQMEENDVKRLKSIFQEEDIFIVVATSPLLFTAVSQRGEPFYHFFDIKHLRELSKEEVKELVKAIDNLEGKSENKKRYDRIDPVITLTGGSPRIVILLYDLMNKSNILDIEDAFFKILDEYTPYYQDVFKTLTGQKKRIFDSLISIEPATPKEIAETAQLNNNTVVTQLRRLEKDGYVVSHRIGNHTKYEVRERLFRLWREQRQPLGRKKISILIEFIKIWYATEEREEEFLNIINRLTVDSRLIKEAEYFFYTFSEESKMKFMPEIARESYRCGMPELLEQCVEPDEPLKRALEIEKLAVLAEEGRHDDFLKGIEKIVRKGENNRITLFLMGIVLLNLERYEEALDLLDETLDIDPHNAGVLYVRGIVLLNLERYEEALDAFDKALGINPDDLTFWMGKGNAFGNLKRYKEALDAFDKALDINPQNAEAWSGKGQALNFLERYKEALDAFDKARDINPQNAAMWYERGVALSNLEQYKEALQAFDESLQGFDRSLKTAPDALWFRKAVIHLQMAIQEFTKNNHRNAIENLNFAMESFLEVWDSNKEEIEKALVYFLKYLTNTGQNKALDISFETIVKKREELVEFLEPISIALEIFKTKNTKKYYDLQVEERDIVADIVKTLTGTEELLPEEYKKPK